MVSASTKKGISLIILSPIISMLFLLSTTSTVFASSRQAIVSMTPKETNSPIIEPRNGIGSDDGYYGGGNQQYSENQGYNKGYIQDNVGNSGDNYGNVLRNQGRTSGTQVNTQGSNLSNQGNGNGQYGGDNQQYSVNQGHNWGYIQDNSSNSGNNYGNEMKNQGDTIGTQVNTQVSTQVEVQVYAPVNVQVNTGFHDR
jgi:hypothetical protein